MHTQYDYKTVFLTLTDLSDTAGQLDSRLGELGKEGWELISAITQPTLGSSQYALIGLKQNTILIFKRPLGESKEDA